MRNQFGNVAGQRRLISQGLQPVSFVAEKGVNSISRARLDDIQRLGRMISKRRIVSFDHGPGAPVRQQDSSVSLPIACSDGLHLFVFHAAYSAEKALAARHGAQRELEPAGMEEFSSMLSARRHSRGTIKRTRPFQRRARWVPTGSLLCSVKAAYLIHDCLQISIICCW